MSFRRVPVQIACEVPRVLMQMLCEIPKGSDVYYGISIFLWQKRRSFQAVGDST